MGLFADIEFALVLMYTYVFQYYLHTQTFFVKLYTLTCPDFCKPLKGIMGKFSKQNNINFLL